MNAIQWISQHWSDLSAVIGAAYVLARLIVKLTPTKKDDQALQWFHVHALAWAAMFGLKLPAAMLDDDDQPPANKQSGRARAEALMLGAILVGALLLLVGCGNEKELLRDALTETRASNRHFHRIAPEPRDPAWEDRFQKSEADSSELLPSPSPSPSPSPKGGQ